MTTPELKPCPFCGGDAKEEVYFVNMGHGDFREDFYVECSSDECRTYIKKPFSSPDDAAKAWNTRAPQPQSASLADMSSSFRQKSEVDTMIFFVEALGFTHRFENGYHIVEGHGFKKDHVSMSCIINRIAGWLEQKSEPQSGDRAKALAALQHLEDILDGCYVKHEIETIRAALIPPDRGID